MSVTFQHLLTLVSKNILVQRRKWPWLLFEICTPISLILILSFVAKMKGDRFFNQTVYQEIPIFGNILDFETNLVDNNLLIDGPNFQPSRIFYAPLNCETEKIIENLRWILEDYGFHDGTNDDCFMMNQSFVSRRFTFEGFVNPQLLEQSLVQILLDSYPVDFYAGIVFISNDSVVSTSKIFAYELRFPDDLRNIRVLSDVKSFVYSWALGRSFVDSADGYHNSSSGGVPDYFHEGFLTLQRALDYAISKTADCSLPKVPFILKRLPHPPFRKRPFLEIFPFVFPALLMLSFSFNVQYVVRTLCADKESRINAYLQAMTGIQLWCLENAHLLVILVKNILVVILLTTTICYGLVDINAFVVGLFLLLYAFNAVFFAFVVSSFFNSVNLASTIVGILWIASYVPAICLQTDILSMNRRQIMMFAWLPSGSAVLFGILVQKVEMEVGSYLEGVLNLFLHVSSKQARTDLNSDYHQLFSRKNRALNDISFDAHANEFTVLLGKNGAGKSTLMHIFTGLENKFSGLINVFNHNITTNMDDIRRIMAYDPQYTFLIDGLTVDEHLEFFSNLKTGVIDKKKSKMLLNNLRLSNKRFEYAKNLSGGQRKRLCLAISLINDYQIAFLDEPTSGIDPSGKYELLDVIQNERRQGKSIFLVTHYVDEAETLGDRIIILDHGRIVCSGAKSDVKVQYGDGYKLSIDLRNGMPISSTGNASRLNVEILKRELSRIVASFYSEATFSCKPLYYTDRVKLVFLLRENIFADFERFMQLTSNLENARPSFVVESIALQMPTMQDVFFNMCSNSNISESNVESAVYLKSDEININFPLFFQQLNALSSKNFIYLFKDQWPIFVGQYLILISTFIAYCLLNDYLIHHDAQYSARKLDLAAFRRSHFYIFIDEYKENSLILQNIIKTSIQFDLAYTLVNFTDDDRVDAFLLNESMLRSDFFDCNFFALKLASQISDFDNSTVILTGYFNIRAIHITPALVNLFSNLVFEHSYEIQTINRPLPQTTVLLYSFGQDFILVLCLLAVLNFFTILPVKRIVDEKQNGQKFLQLISGMKLKAYWLSNYVCDLPVFILGTMLVIVIWTTMGIDLLCENGAWIHMVFIFTLFNLAVVSWIYAISFLFDSSAGAITASLAIGSLVGLGPFLIVTTLNSLSNDNDWLNAVQRRISSACSTLFPQFALCQALSVYYRNKMLIKQCTRMKNCVFLESGIDENFKITYSALEWKSPGVGYFLACFVWQSAFHWIVICMFENLSAVFRCWLYFVSCFSPEKHTAEQKEVDPRCVLEVRDVTVQYSNHRKAAVQNLSFNVGRGDILGLNGSNGSGKSTTYKLLTGEIEKSRGSVFVESNLIEKSNPSEMSRFIGFCPQFDYLIEYLTVKQCLRYFAALRGIPNGDIQEVVESLLQSLELINCDKLVKNLSGGKKRLLSICIALLGSSTLILLDEPTCGVDPTARRKVWAVLQAMKKMGCSMILTSHDMEECEAVCDRMLIMSNGRSIGCHPIHTWVENYSVSQTVEIVLKPDVDIDTFTTSFEMLIPNSKLKERNTYRNSAIFSVSKIENSSSILNWSQLFGKLNHLRQSFDIERFSVYQPPFRDVFTAAVGQQNV